MLISLGGPYFYLSGEVCWTIKVTNKTGQMSRLYWRVILHLQKKIGH